jgi:hypothetical protein
MNRTGEQDTTAWASTARLLAALGALMGVASLAFTAYLIFTNADYLSFMQPFDPVPTQFQKLH